LNYSPPNPIAHFIRRVEYGLLIAFIVILPMLRGQFLALEVLFSGVMYSFIGLACLQHWKRLIYVVFKDWGLTALMALAFLSIVWSANADNTSYEFRFLIRSTFLGLYIASRYQPKEIMRLVTWALSITILLSLLTCFFIPQTGITVKNGVRVWVGVFTHKQACGTYMALAASFFAARFFGKSRYRWGALIGLAAALGFVILSDSKTALVICILSIALTPLHRITEQKKLRGLTIVIAVGLISLIVGFMALNFQVIVVEFLGKDVLLTGRLPVWVLSIFEGLKRPWLGYGYAGFWSSDAADVILSNSWAVRDQAFRSRTLFFHAHNGFIDLFLQLGYVGVGLFIFSFITFVIRAIRLSFSTQSLDYFWMIQFAGIFFITNITEALIIVSPSYLWVLYVAFAYATALRQHQRRIRPSPAQSVKLTAPSPVNPVS
jgi:exopolysaccharide production protein ExoQ